MLFAIVCKGLFTLIVRTGNYAVSPSIDMRFSVGERSSDIRYIC